MNRDIANMRENYQWGNLMEENIKDHPVEQFKIWFDDAVNQKISEPNAMILATVSADHIPSARTVLLKGIEDQGFIFYTNYASRKGQDINQNANVSLLFLWKDIERQVRIRGKATKISKQQSEAYFHKRPKGSQIGAWTSPQSQLISDRSILEERKETLEKQYENEENLPLPEFWGGYIVKPKEIEFWQGRTSRLHDRILYTKNGTSWDINRLAP